MTDESNRARYIMIGGFLGAGKTTAIQALATYLHDRRRKVGLITNDQGAGLVDSALGKSHHFPVEEISGGCFCCRFNSLIDAAKHLAKSGDAPEVFLAEPVGSCTDLVATVSLPLQQIYGAEYVVAPLSVLVDPVRALRVLELEKGGKRFSKNVVYIYRKQLQEADIIVINKIDSVSTKQLDALRAGLASEFPDARIMEISAREGDGSEAWFETLLAEEMNSSRFLEIDYKTYAKGEALLGWLNATLKVDAGSHYDDGEFDGNQLLEEMAVALRGYLLDHDIEVAHLKMTLTPEGDPYEIGAVNLVRTDAEPELSHRLLEPIDCGELLLNIRAEADPKELEAACQTAFREIIEDQMGLSLEVVHSEHFRPGKPVPTHRVTANS